MNYREAAEIFEGFYREDVPYPSKQDIELAARVLRALADGAVLCKGEPVARVYTDAESRHRDPRWGRLSFLEPEEELPGGALLYLAATP